MADLAAYLSEGVGGVHVSYATRTLYSTFARRAGYAAIHAGEDSGQPPTVINFLPAVGTQLATSDQVRFDVVDIDSAMRNVFVWVTYSGSDDWEVIYDGASFAPSFSGSTRTTVTNGYRFNLLRSGGWPGTAINVHVRAIDIRGNENS